MSRRFTPIQVQNGALTHMFNQLASEVQGKVLEEAAGAAAEVIRAEAERRAPVGSGENRRGQPLKDNIVTTAGTKHSPKRGTGGRFTKHNGVVFVGASKKAFHGDFLELGTVKMAARPWLRPAFDTAKEAAIKAYKEVMARRIFAFARRGA